MPSRFLNYFTASIPLAGAGDKPHRGGGRMHPSVLLEVNVAGEGSKFDFGLINCAKIWKRFCAAAFVDRRLNDNPAAGEGGGSVA